MPFNIKITPATIKALATLVLVLDKHRFGAVMFILVILASGAAVALSELTILMA